MSGEVWYGVAKGDVFPETFAPFLLGNPRVRSAFMRHHSDLLEPEFWQRNKERIQRREVIDFYPYGVHRRFDTRGGIWGDSARVDAAGLTVDASNGGAQLPTGQAHEEHSE